MMRVTRYPAIKPRGGEINKASAIFPRPGSRIAANPLAAKAAPIKPPINACEDEAGIPRYQVITRQSSAPKRAATNISILTLAVSNKSAPRLRATATPNKNGPTNSPRAVSSRAARGCSAREEITVATMLAESLRPFKKTNKKARMKNKVNIGGSPQLSAIRYKPEARSVYHSDGREVLGSGSRFLDGLANRCILRQV